MAIQKQKLPSPMKKNHSMLFRSFLLCIVLITSGAQFHAQSDTLKNALNQLGKTGDISPGKVTVDVDTSIVNLEKGTRKFKETKGYRIQLLIGPLEQVKNERNKYLSLGYPYSAYQKSIVPDYALQVGDFPTRMEMEKHLEILRKQYPKAFGVVEFIEPPKFVMKK
jgi:SPOR domain